MKKLLLLVTFCVSGLLQAKLVTVRALTICPAGSERLADGSCLYRATAEPKCPGDSQYVSYKGGCITYAEIESGKKKCPPGGKLQEDNETCLFKAILSPICPEPSEYIFFKKGCIAKPTCPAGFTITGDCLAESCICTKLLTIETAAERRMPAGYQKYFTVPDVQKLAQERAARLEKEAEQKKAEDLAKAVVAAKIEAAELERIKKKWTRPGRDTVRIIPKKRAQPDPSLD